MSLNKSAVKRLRQLARREFCLPIRNNWPVIIIPGGHLPPKMLGSRYHYTTRSGLPIYHPSAYARRGWSSMVYHRSTRRIYVGELYGSTQ